MGDLARATLTNLEAGPRGVETAAGLVMIEAGAEARVEIESGDLGAAVASGWFTVATTDEPRPRGRRER